MNPGPIDNAVLSSLQIQFWSHLGEMPTHADEKGPQKRGQDSTEGIPTLLRSATRSLWLGDQMVLQWKYLFQKPATRHYFEWRRHCAIVA